MESSIVDNLEAASLLKNHGWETDRQVKVDPKVDENHPAHAILKSLGGVYLPERKNGGLHVGSMDIKFQYASFSGLPEWKALFGSELVGVGICERTYSHLWVSHNGACFISEIVDLTMGFVAKSIGTAIYNLHFGIPIRPILLPGQKKIVYYGETIEAGDPRIFTF